MMHDILVYCGMNDSICNAKLLLRIITMFVQGFKMSWRQKYLQGVNLTLCCL